MIRIKKGTTGHTGTVRLSPKMASHLSNERRSMIEDQISSGTLRETRSYVGSNLHNPPEPKPPGDANRVSRGTWLVSQGIEAGGGDLPPSVAIAHSPAYRKALQMQKQAASILALN